MLPDCLKTFKRRREACLQQIRLIGKAPIAKNLQPGLSDGCLSSPNRRNMTCASDD